MAINTDIYNLYIVKNKQHLLTRVSRPGYSNANQIQENEAWKIYDLKQEMVINSYITENKHLSMETIKHLGEFQGLPEGDILYKKNGTKSIDNIRYARINNGCHVYITIAKSDAEFWEQTEEDDFADIGITKEDLTVPVCGINKVCFITEHDYDLSAILDFNTEDLEDKRRAALS